MKLLAKRRSAEAADEKFRLFHSLRVDSNLAYFFYLISVIFSSWLLGPQPKEVGIGSV